MEVASARRAVRLYGIWSIVFGIWAAALGLSNASKPDINIVMGVIGLALIATGIAARGRAPGTGAALANALAFLALAAGRQVAGEAVGVVDDLVMRRIDPRMEVNAHFRAPRADRGGLPLAGVARMQ